MPPAQFLSFSVVRRMVAQSRQIHNYSAHKVLDVEVALLIGLVRCPPWSAWTGTKTNALSSLMTEDQQDESVETLVHNNSIWMRERCWKACQIRIEKSK